MGQGCFTPINKFKKQPQNNIEEKIKKNDFIPKYNYSEVLKQILDDITVKYLNLYIKDDLQPRTLPRRSISRNTDNEIPIITLEPQEIVFFDEKFSIDDLEEFLSNCSHNLSPSSLNDSNDSQCMSLYDGVMSGSVDIEKLNKNDMKDLLKNQKIHLKLAENESQIDILTKLFERADYFGLVTKIIDSTDEFGNPAISIAVLTKNSFAFFYLLKRLAGIPLNIFEKKYNVMHRTPFLIYLALHGRMRKSKEPNQVEYVLYKVLDHILYVYEKTDFLEHLTIIDEKTQMSLPHLLLYLYKTSADLKSSIIDCLRLCIQKYPDCAGIMCVNHYEPQFKFDVLANCISHPELSGEEASELVKHLRPCVNKNNKAVLRHLVKVHQSKEKKAKLLKSLD